VQNTRRVAILAAVSHSSDHALAHHRARVERARAMAADGRHAPAERTLRESLGALTRRSAYHEACDAAVTLGRLLLERGRAGAAQRAFSEAEDMASAAEDSALVLRTSIWRAVALIDDGRAAEAEALCRGTDTPEGGMQALRGWRNAVLARALLWQDATAEAVRVALADLPDADAPAEDRAYATSVAVRVLLATGRLFDAGQRARAAMACCAGRGAPLELMAGIAHFRVLAATGDLVLCRAAFDHLERLAGQCHAPLRLARARLIWYDALFRAGEQSQARAQRRILVRLCKVAPLGLRTGIDARLAAARHPSTLAVSSPGGTAPITAAELVKLGQQEGAPVSVCRGLVTRVVEGLAARRLDVSIGTAGRMPALTVVGRSDSWGSGGDGNGLASAADPVTITHPFALVGSVARIEVAWGSRQPPPSNAREILHIAAAVMTPLVQAMADAASAAAADDVIPELVGSSVLLCEVRRAISRAARAPFPVLILGESGVGKELVARAIHRLGPRRARRFADLNCAALPEDLIDSELFGHVRGAFTGAVTDQVGLFEQAHGGTLFLDEVVDLSPRGQAKLLRAVQQQEIRRVGDTQVRAVDVRLIAAANRDIGRDARDGRFRQDLLYRLDVIRIRVAPLRERPEDVPLLAEHFWEAAASRVGSKARLTRSALASLARYPWPGNVRELQNVMAAVAVGAPSRGFVTAAALPPLEQPADRTTVTLADVRAEAERKCVVGALARAGGSRTRAARELGLTRQGLLKTMARLEITP
jgi:two-component system NtrC family response regulator